MQHYVLGDVITEISERENNPSNTKYERFVGLEHYVSGEVEIENYGSTANLNSAMKVFNSGDILVARRNVYLKRASVVYFDGLTSGDSIVLRPKNETIGRILPFILNTDDFWDYADQYSDGTMSKRLSPKVLKQYEFDLPDDNLEQLADILWAMVDVKKSYQCLLKQTDELVKSQFIEMFGTIESEGIFPRKEWSEVLSIINGKDYRKIEVKTGGYPVYGSGGYMARASEFLCPANTVVVGRKGTINNPLLIKEEFWNVDTAFGLVSGPEINPVYLHWFCLQFDFTTLNKATTLPSTTKSDLLKLKMNVPPIDSQNQFEKFVEQSDKSKFELKQAIEGVDILIKSMLQQELN